MYDEVVSIIIKTVGLKNRYLISTDEILKTIKVLYTRNDKAVSILNKRKEEYEDFSWVEMPRESYYEECDEIINLLKGDDENEEK